MQHDDAHFLLLFFMALIAAASIGGTIAMLLVNWHERKQVRRHRNGRF